MTKDKIYNNPTVKQVIFQITFPNLFFLEMKIADLQLKILNRFPESSLLIQQPIMILTGSPENKEADKEKIGANKIWQFANPDGYKLSVAINSISITSDIHKTYNIGTENRFRDIIEFCLKVFGEVVNIPYVNRIGLRYIDECPLQNKNNESYKESFASGINIDKYNLDDVSEAKLKIVKKHGDVMLIYQEAFDNKDITKVILDFDAYQTNVDFSECLEVTDELHKIISEEYYNTIKQPIINYMEGKNDK